MKAGNRLNLTDFSTPEYGYELRRVKVLMLPNQGICDVSDQKEPKIGNIKANKIIHRSLECQRSTWIKKREDKKRKVVKLIEVVLK